MREGFIKDTTELVIKEIQSVITIGYLFLVGIGMLFTYQRYEEFGINIFEYADVFDFLIAPFRDLGIVGFTVATSLFVSFFYFMDIFVARRFPKTYSKLSFHMDQSPSYKWVRLGGFAFMLITYIYFGADAYGSRSARQALEQDPISITFTDGSQERGFFLGKTQEVIFLQKGKGKKASIHIYPISTGVQEIRWK